jgi:hypothetical protein
MICGIFLKELLDFQENPLLYVATKTKLNSVALVRERTIPATNRYIHDSIATFSWEH